MQSKEYLLEKWFPLQGELIPCIFCMHVNRKEEEWETEQQQQQQPQTYQFTQGYNILHRLQVHHLTLIFIIHISTLHLYTYIYICSNHNAFY